ncbi:hypothetical protein OH77DRAFT_394883 [Trametes cingulata]|nr:hypothetical protein OH77DRAFT_394883 [Trametes cingulata]
MTPWWRTFCASFAASRYLETRRTAGRPVGVEHRVLAVELDGVCVLRSCRGVVALDVQRVAFRLQRLDLGLLIGIGRHPDVFAEQNCAMCDISLARCATPHRSDFSSTTPVI